MDAKPLRDALTIARLVVGGSSSAPLLGNVALHTEQGVLWLDASNLDVFLRLPVCSWYGQDLACCVNLAALGKLLVKWQGRLELQLSDGKLALQCGLAEATLPVSSVEEFPTFVPCSQEIADLNAAVLAEAHERVSPFCCSAKDGRPVLATVLLDMLAKRVSFVAANGYELALLEPTNGWYPGLAIWNDADGERPMQLLLNPLVCKVVAALADGTSLVPVLLRVELGEKGRLKGLPIRGQFSLSRPGLVYANAVVQWQVTEGTYPEYGKIVAGAATELTALVPAAPLLQALDGLQGLATDLLAEIHLVFDSGGLTVSTKQNEEGQAQTRVPALVYRPAQVRLAMARLRRSLKAAGAEATFCVGEGATPVRVQGERHWQSVIFPIVPEKGR
jgi:hypothetical protein